jgi:hypothetical protein
MKPNFVIKKFFYSFQALGVFLVNLQNDAAAFEFKAGDMLGGSSVGFATIGGQAAFLTNLEFDYFLDHNFSVGGQMLFAASDFFIWAPQAEAKYTFDINSSDNEWFNDLKPHVQALLGFVVSADNGSTLGFLGGFGFGADYQIRDRWFLGSDMLFEFGNDIADSNAAWFWKVLTVKYLF